MYSFLAIIIAYCWGSVPTAYLVARNIEGIDIRDYGTGNVGASNVIIQMGRRLGVSIGLFDGLAKGTIPIILAKLLDLSLLSQIGIGLASVAGHNWSIFLGFTGGRGVSTALGTYVGFGLWQQLIVGIVIVGLVGWLLFRNLALWMLIGIAFMGVLVYILQQPSELAILLFGLTILIALKRLFPNWKRPTGTQPLWMTLVYRLLYDRDVARRDDWVERKPDKC